MAITSLTRTRASLAACLLALLTTTAARAGAHVVVTVRGTSADVTDTPIVAPAGVGLAGGNYVLKPGGNGPAIPAQVFAEGGKPYLAFVLDQLKAGQSETFALEPEAGKGNRSAGVALVKDGPNVVVNVGGNLFTKYVTDTGPKPFYFPVIGPNGKRFSRAFPMEKLEGEDKDHPHQRSLWFTHGNVNGIDFWSEQSAHGSIKETSRQLVTAGPAVGVIQTTDDWLGPDGKKVCEDERVVRFYNTKATRVLDFDITIKATAGPVTFGDTKEGMFGVRMASSMDVKRKQGGKITNAEGTTDNAAWGKASPWVDYVGPVEGETVGIAILNHPSSFRYPTTWHVRDYGLFAANPFGWHDFGRDERGDYTLPAGKSLVFRYRMIFHKGDTASASVPAAFKAYEAPPAVVVAGP